MITYTVKPAHEVTSIKQSLVLKGPVIINFIYIQPLLRGHLSYKITFSLYQRWPLNTGLKCISTTELSYCTGSIPTTFYDQYSCFIVRYIWTLKWQAPGSTLKKAEIRSFPTFQCILLLPLALYCRLFYHLIYNNRYQETVICILEENSRALYLYCTVNTMITWWVNISNWLLD